MNLPSNLQKIIRITNDFQISTFTEADFKDKLTILYFYPKNGTPGCTVESCGFRDLNTSIDKSKFQIVGVSRDDMNSHKKFIVKHDLNFSLVSDPNLELAKIFGVAKERSMFGKRFMTNERSTFILDTKGQITKEFRNVNPISHITELRKYLANLD